MSPSLLPAHSFTQPVVKVLIVDDHAAIIEMMALVVESLPRFKVAGRALDATAAIEICRSQAVNIVILDLVMPGMSGFELLVSLKTIDPQARVLIFTGNLNSTTMHGTLSPNVFGVVEKTASLEIFRQALLAVAAGRTYFGPQASELIKDLVARKPAAGQATELTSREKTVLSFIAQGLSSKEIAHQLNLSLHTVINHRSNLMKKTGLRRVAQLSLLAARMGLVGETSAR